MYDFEIKKEWLVLNTDKYIENEFAKSCELYQLRCDFRIKSKKLSDEKHTLEINGLFDDEQDYIMDCRQSSIEYDFEEAFKSIHAKYEPKIKPIIYHEILKDGEPVSIAPIGISQEEEYDHAFTEELLKQTVNLKTEEYDMLNNDYDGYDDEMTVATDVKKSSVDIIKVNWTAKACGYYFMDFSTYITSQLLLFIPLAFIYVFFKTIYGVLLVADDMAGNPDPTRNIIKKYGVKKAVINNKTQE